MKTIFQGTNSASDYYIKAGSVYIVTLSLAPKTIHHWFQIENPFFSTLSGSVFAGHSKIPGNSALGRGHRSLTLQVSALKEGYFNNIVDSSGTNASMVLGDTTGETITMQINWQFLSA